MPEEDIHIGDWNGTGYIILDMNSGSGIYRISGGLNGGYTQGEVVYDAMVDFGLELSWIIEGLISIFSVINTVAAKGILTAGMTGNVIIAGLFVGLTFWSCANTFTLLGAYLDGDEAAGEAIVKETITDAIMTIGFMMFKYVAKPIVELLVKNKLIKNLRKWNVADDVISEFAKNFGKEGLTWLEKASKQGLSSEIMTQLSQLEGFANNMDDILYGQITGEIHWSENDGFKNNPIDEILQPGTRIDRYGSDFGTFTSPEGIPYEQRAVAPGTDLKPYSVFEVIEPIKVKSGIIAPWFDEPGGGIQYL